VNKTDVILDLIIYVLTYNPNQECLYH